MHLSIAGGLPKSLDRAQVLGCQALQIFLQNPRGWRWRPVSRHEIDNFLEKRRLHRIDPVIAHLSYLPNLAAADDQLYCRSWERLRQELTLGKSLGLDYLVCHPGSCLLQTNLVLNALPLVYIASSQNCRLLP